jgi:type VI secretion system secreted protein VgrG
MIMKKFRKSSIVTVLAVSFVVGLTAPLTALAATAPNLGVADSFSLWGKSGVGNTGTGTHVWGNVGADLLSNITGLIASQVDGTMQGPVTNLQTDATAAYGALNGWGADGTKNLSTPQTVTPGVWTLNAAQTLTGAIVLDGAGVYIFRSDSAYTVANAATVSLTGGATACNVFWQIPTFMTIGTTAHVEGTIITNSGTITLQTGSTLKGRALSLVSNVALDTNQVTAPCAAVARIPDVIVTPPLPPVFTPPLINVTKIPTPLALPNGPGSVTYNYTVLNVGTVPMSNVTVSDNKCSPVSYVSGDTNGDSKLDMTETWKYRCTTTLSQTTTNTVTATGQNSGLTATDTAEAIVVVGAPLIPPLIHLVKVPNVFVLPAGGGVVTYYYSVTNPGTVPLSDISITDNKCTGLPGRVVGHPGDINKNNLLDPGETFHFTCQTNITQTTTNIGTATGHANGFTITDTSPATVVVAPSAVVPKLPNTGFPSSGTSTPWDAVIAIGILMLVSSSLVALKKRTV